MIRKELTWFWENGGWHPIDLPTEYRHIHGLRILLVWNQLNTLISGFQLPAIRGEEVQHRAEGNVLLTVPNIYIFSASSQHDKKIIQSLLCHEGVWEGGHQPSSLIELLFVHRNTVADCRQKLRGNISRDPHTPLRKALH